MRTFTTLGVERLESRDLASATPVLATPVAPPKPDGYAGTHALYQDVTIPATAHAGDGGRGPGVYRVVFIGGWGA